MPHFSPASRQRLNTCHIDLQVIFCEVIEQYDFTVICGWRSKEDQESAVATGRSQVHWPESKHNKTPSMAIDVAPYPIDWNDHGAFTLLAGWVLCTAERLWREGRVSHKLRWGGDWNSNRRTKDQRFNDLPHFELVPV